MSIQTHLVLHTTAHTLIPTRQYHMHPYTRTCIPTRSHPQTHVCAHTIQSFTTPKKHTHPHATPHIHMYTSTPHIHAHPKSSLSPMHTREFTCTSTSHHLIIRYRNVCHGLSVIGPSKSLAATQLIYSGLQS